MKTPILKTILIAALLGCAPALSAADKPLKVFILAGQSNMQGHAHVSTIDSMKADPKTAPIHEFMHNPDGTPRVSEKVWISSISSAPEEQVGRLTTGFGAANKGPKIGPELTFGLYMEKFLDQPILLIKTAWGGRNQHAAFRPPGAGEAGPSYQLMMEHVKHVLADIKRVYPDYDPKQGYEVARCVWFQGWNDYVDRRAYPNSDYSAYSELLAHLIRDVRKELDAPKMPFVVGVLGVGGQKEADHPFRMAMAAPADMPEFKGNVFNVFTVDYWDDELDELFNRAWRARDERHDPEGRYADIRPALLEHEKQQAEAKDLSRNERREMARKRLDILYTPEEQVKLQGTSNKPFHYLGAAKILTRIGKAFAETMA